MRKSLCGVDPQSVSSEGCKREPGSERWGQRWRSFDPQRGSGREAMRERQELEMKTGRQEYGRRGERGRERERERGTQSERWGTVPQRGSGKSKRCPERSRWRPYLGVLGWTAGRGYLQATVRSLDREVEGIILGYHGGCRPCPLGCHR